jgi:signal transduction histidine kinase
LSAGAGKSDASGAPEGGLTGTSLGRIVEELGRLRAENARLLAGLAESERRFRSISRGVLQVQEAERGRISRELHDGVGQSLTALKLHLELLTQAASAGADPMGPRLVELVEQADHALQEVRQISRLLRPPMLDDLGLGPTLRWLARSFRERTGIAVSLTSEGIDDWADAELSTLVFRVVQEALTNVAKHARAATAEVFVRRSAERLLVRVEEARAAEGEDQGLGLRGMRDRVALFGGRWQLRSAPGQGTRLEMEVALEARGDQQDAVLD